MNRGWALGAVVLLVAAPAGFAQSKKRPAARPVVKKPAAAAPALPAPIKPMRPSPVWSVAFSPGGYQIAVGTYRKVTLFDVAAGTRVAEWALPPAQGGGDAARSIAFSKDGKLVAVGTGVPAQSGAAVIFDAATGKPSRVITSHFDAVEAVAFAADNTLLSAADDEKVRVTDVRSGKEIGVLGDHVGRCLSVAVPTAFREADGGEIFATGGADNALKIWDARTRRVVVNFDQCASPVWAVAALPQPGRFVAGSGDGRLRVFGVRSDPDGKAGDGARTGYVARTFGPGNDIAIYAVAASPDGKTIVSGGADKKVRVWRASDGGQIRELTEATGDIYGLAISADNKYLAAASADGKARVYTLDDGKLVLTLP